MTLRNSKSLLKQLSRVAYMALALQVASSVAYSPEREFSPSQKPEELKGLAIEEKPGSKLDLNLEFIDEKGQKVKLAQYFIDDQPVLLSIIYFGCPNLCGLHLNGISEALKALPGDFRKKMQLVLVSMDSTELPKLAREKKENYIKKYSLSPENSHFLTGKKQDILALSQQLGFRFKWDESQKMYAHLPVAYALTPEGRISRYLYGITFIPQTLRLSMVEASEKKIASIMDRVLLFCFQFDPKRRRYSWYAYNIMRAGGVLTLFLFLCFLLPVWLKESKKLRKKGSTS